MTARSRWAWLEMASCATRSDLPWIAEPADVTSSDAEKMTALCASCPVHDSCTETAAAWEVSAGWWAGSPRDDTPCETPEPMEPVGLWAPVVVGRSRRALAGVWQGLLDVCGAA